MISIKSINSFEILIFCEIQITIKIKNEREIRKTIL